jgi:hypothetical protein
MDRGPRISAVLAGTLATLVLALGLSACAIGGSDDEGGGTTATGATRLPSPTTTTPTPPSGGRGGGNVDPADVGVVLAWATTLQRGDVAGAAEFFALPSAVANGTRPAELTTRAQVRAFNRSLPCGAELIDTRAAAADFFVATFRLTERPGGDCGSGTGHTARTAFHVTDGLIDHWLRVEDLEQAPAPATPS